MFHLKKIIPVVLIFIGFHATACIFASDLLVGEGKPYSRLEEALAKAKPGDQIIVSPLKDSRPYRQTALQIKTAKLTIRSADPTQRVRLDGDGFNYSGRGAVPRAIIQFDPGANGCLLEGFELVNAHNESFNGAGVRINQANDITIRHCHIQHNDMGIMSNGSVMENTGANQLIEGCIITDNGSEKQPGQNHNLYLGGTSVTVRACEIARSLTGHDLKSRAHLNWIEYNYLHDSSNRELDLVDAAGNTDIPESHTVLLGNLIVKKKNINGNKNVIHFGRDGKASHNGMLYVIHNTIVSQYVSPIIDLSSGQGVIFCNNRLDDAGANQAGLVVAVRGGEGKIEGKGNLIPKGFQSSLPSTITGLPIMQWDQLDLPWMEGKRLPLMQYKSVGQIVPRAATKPGAADEK